MNALAVSSGFPNHWTRGTDLRGRWAQYLVTNPGERGSPSDRGAIADRRDRHTDRLDGGGLMLRYTANKLPIVNLSQETLSRGHQP